MNREQQILPILYEMALIIGGETSVKPLLMKTLQRLLYHTSFPAGLVFLDLPPDTGAPAIEGRLDAAVGDYGLGASVGRTVSLPAALLRGGAELREDAALLEALPGPANPYSVFLRLPIDPCGVILLLAPAAPHTELPLTRIFQPVMANLAKAILLCRNNEAYTNGILAERDVARETLRKVRQAELALRESENRLRGIITEHKRMEEQLKATLAEKEVLVQSLSELAIRDGLTGLYNHRAFYKLLEDELVRAQRFDRPVSLLLLDIDHFKRVNDTHGHLAGDAVIKGLGELLGREVRAIDRMCRYGGEEITVILPETDLEAAAHFAERLRAAVEAQPFDVNAGAPLRMTVSIGVACWPAQADNAQALVAAADAAMYAAKQGGRNRVIRYEPAPVQPITRG